MSYSKRQGRALFLAFLCSAWVLVLMAAPLVSALEPASAGASRDPAFARADRNGDGYVDRREARAVRGLATVLPLVDRNLDGRLDQIEYARGLGLGAAGERTGREAGR